ncbi:MAG: amino acid permease [Parvularculaceae bacterium]
MLLVLIFGQARIFFVMGRDRLLPSFMGSVHSRFGHTSPCGDTDRSVGVAFSAAFFPLDVIAELSNIGTLFAFIAIALGVMILRRARPDLARPFRTPMLWFVGPGAVLSCAYLMYSLPAATWVRFAVWTLVGMLFYGVYGYWRSTLREPAAAAEGTH